MPAFNGLLFLKEAKEVTSFLSDKYYPYLRSLIFNHTGMYDKHFLWKVKFSLLWKAKFV